MRSPAMPFSPVVPPGPRRGWSPPRSGTDHGDQLADQVGDLADPGILAFLPEVLGVTVPA